MLSVNIAPAELVDGRHVITRVIAEIRDQSEDGAVDEVRPVGAWVALLSDSSIGVHIGREQIARLAGPEAVKIRAAINRWGAGTNTLGADADLLGSTTSDAHLDMFLPTPTDV